MTAAVAALTLATGTPSAPKPDDPPAACKDARKAIVYYRGRYNHHRDVMGSSSAPALEQHMGCRRARERARYWQRAAAANRKAAAAYLEREYDWSTWLPAKWFRVARCETGVNWEHDSGTYVSAFGIYRPGYADDAHRVGNLSWDETIRIRGTVPTPREQYEAALSHYRAHGGFSGWGCRGA